MKIKSYLFVFMAIPAITFCPMEARADWQQDNNSWKYTEAGQYKRLEWLLNTEDAHWYYFDANAKMVTGLYSINGINYYFNSNGSMLTGWQQINNKWYYFNPDGSGANGWIMSGNDWYYAENGTAATHKWLEIDGQRYYFDKSSRMATNTYVGKTFLGKDGLPDNSRTLTDWSNTTIKDVDFDTFTSVMENIPSNILDCFFESNGRMYYDSQREILKTYNLIDYSIDSGAQFSGNSIRFHNPEDLYYAFAEYSNYVTRSSDSAIFKSWVEDGTIPELLDINIFDTTIYSTVRSDMYAILAESILDPESDFPSSEFPEIEHFVRESLESIQATQ